MTPRQRTSGFTLPELLIGMAIVALLGSLTASSYRQWAAHTELRRQMSDFIAAAHTARRHAFDTGQATLLAAQDPADWQQGWRVYVDRNGNTTWDAGIDPLLLQHPAAPQWLVIRPPPGNSGHANTLAAGYLRFNAQGFPRTHGDTVANGQLQFQAGELQYSVFFAQSGRVRQCRRGTC